MATSGSVAVQKTLKPTAAIASVAYSRGMVPTRSATQPPAASGDHAAEQGRDTDGGRAGGQARALPQCPGAHCITPSPRT